MAITDIVRKHIAGPKQHGEELDLKYKHPQDKWFKKYTKVGKSKMTRYSVYNTWNQPHIKFVSTKLDNPASWQLLASLCIY